MVTVKRVILISILVFFMLAPMNAQAQATPIGVEIECDDSTIDINVHPEQNQPVSVSCTVTNTGLVKEQIDVDWSVDGNDFSVDVPGDNSWDIDAGESESFTAVFTASPRIEVKSEDFNITATVVSATIGGDPVTIPLGQLASTAEVGGTVNSLAYSRMTFQVLDKGDIIIDEAIDDEEDGETIQLSIFNDGNIDDTIVVELVNSGELDDLGIAYTFFNPTTFYVGFDEYRETVASGATSNAGTMIFGIGELPDEDVSFEIELLAYSLNDDDTQPIKVTVDVVISGGSSGGALGLDSVSSSDLKLIGMAGGGLIGVILLLVIISRLTKKTAGKQKVAQKEAKKAAKAERKSGKKSKKSKPVVVEESSDDDFDFDDDFDDDFDFDDL